jgi:hypothetical protein
MSFTESRRDFVLSGARAGAAAAVVGAMPAAFAATPAAQNVADAASADLLQALGARIGLEVASEIGSQGDALTLAYLDAAGDSVDALRVGLEQGLSWQTGRAASSVESPSASSSLLGVALISNAVNGRSARVEINATSLSMLTMIEADRTPASSKKLSVLTANSDNFYRVQYVA